LPFDIEKYLPFKVRVAVFISSLLSNLTLHKSMEMAKASISNGNFYIWKPTYFAISTFGKVIEMPSVG
jgi:hypothetical protein